MSVNEDPRRPWWWWPAAMLVAAPIVHVISTWFEEFVLP